MSHEIENNLVASLVVDATQGPALVILGSKGIGVVVRSGPVGDYTFQLENAEGIGFNEETTSCACIGVGNVAAEITHLKESNPLSQQDEYEVQCRDSLGSPIDTIFSMNIFRVRTGNG